MSSLQDINALSQPVDANGRKLLWAFGVNDEHIEELPSDKLKEYKPIGTFRVDYAALSAKCGVVCHPGFVPTTKAGFVGAAAKAGRDASKDRAASKSAAADPDGRDCSVLAVQSMLMGRAAMLVFRQVIPTSLHLEILRFNSCCLDIEGVALLRAGLTESCSVAVLQLDWNPLEVPLDAAAFRAAFDASQMEQIDALEKKREQQQAERTLRAFGEVLTASFGDVPAAMQTLREVAVKDRMHHAPTAGLEPFPLTTWTDAFYTAGLSHAEQIFNLVDGPLYGSGDCLVSFDSLGDILQSLPALSPEEEAADPVGKAFGAFVDASSPLDVVSFRHCSLGRLECVAIGAALGQSTHLRGLNLWGNNICDLGCAVLAESFEVYYGLQFLGLGRNMVTHVGLETLCAPLGYTRIDDKAQVDQVKKSIGDRTKDKEKWAKSKPAPKKDACGQDRYLPDFTIPTCESQTDENGEYWLWGRNTTLKTLNLEHNPIKDAAALMKIQPNGLGEIHLRGVPCAEELSRLARPELVEASRAAPAELEEDPAQAAPPAEKPPSPVDAMAQTPGWRFIFK